MAEAEAGVQLLGSAWTFAGGSSRLIRCGARAGLWGDRPPRHPPQGNGGMERNVVYMRCPSRASPSQILHAISVCCRDTRCSRPGRNRPSLRCSTTSESPRGAKRREADGICGSCRSLGQGRPPRRRSRSIPRTNFPEATNGHRMSTNPASAVERPTRFLRQ